MDYSLTCEQMLFIMVNVAKLVYCDSSEKREQVVARIFNTLSDAQELPKTTAP